MKPKKIGFIGIGNMAEAIIKGINKNCNNNYEIFGTSRSVKKIEDLVDQKMIKKIDNPELLIENSDFIFLGIKPKDSIDLLEQLSKFSIKDKTIISMVAGLPTEAIFKSLNYKSTKIIRIMPNLNAQIGQSLTAYFASWEMSELERKEIEFLLLAFGNFLEIPESSFADFTALAGSGPALILEFYKVFEKFALDKGFGKNDAKKMITNVFLPTLENYKLSNLPIDTLIDNICSPGGTTIEGINVFRERGISEVIFTAMEAIIRKSDNLI
ncbi:pyrroline-5-carboxylate reductase [Spiroplasma sabaudiense Ar-1343]|uniref:Pyrroline-5-carboxylate reductase n=1 Tax=Spiroplasma sabaudiense Ar-1343 TaxID=1276257 RepID=W6AAF7_9MOLU|nr:pyrroline-5-carboxylate reductase [Spiroplasma sabaudiense]AHI54168.1 pyrroline-5-carboxylate reductase [Spiroplasma sabaudiense Ar-1343]